jgi:hypothetical protein
LRLREKIHTDDRAITHEAPDGQRTTLAWDQVVRVVDRPVLQRLDVHGDDGFTILWVENQLERFDRLRDIVLERSRWEDREAVPALPATFTRTTAFWMTVVTFPFLGLGLDAVLGNGPSAGLALGLLALAGLCDWLLIRVDRSGITFRHLLWRRTIPVDQIDDVRIETFRPGCGNALLAVSIRMRNGKARRIVTVRGGALSLYRTLLAVVRSESS